MTAKADPTAHGSTATGSTAMRPTDTGRTIHGSTIVGPTSTRPTAIGYLAMVIFSTFPARLGTEGVTERAPYTR